MIGSAYVLVAVAWTGCDWYVTPEQISEAGDRDGDGFVSVRAGGVDCNDATPLVNPLVPERCDDGIDNNCDGNVDDYGDGSLVWYQDMDGDRFGRDDVTRLACADTLTGLGWSLTAGDCDDADLVRHPAADDQDCDGIDDDCDGVPDDEAPLLQWFVDADGDGYGDPLQPLSTCDQPFGVVANDDDCDDTVATTHPAADEVDCSGNDEDCDGIADEESPPGVWFADEDGDGFGNLYAPVPGICTAPAGSVDNDDDCDDTDVTVLQVCQEEVTDDQGVVYQDLTEAVEDFLDVIHLNHGHFVGVGPVLVGHSVTILGAGSEYTTLSNSVTGAIFELGALIDVTIEGVTLQGPNTGIEVGLFTNLTLVDVVFEGTTGTIGAGIYAPQVDTMTLEDVYFTSTSSVGNGGGLYVQGAVSSGSPPGIAATGIDLVDVTFEDTSSGGSGGAIYAAYVDLSCTGCRFADTDGLTGGAIHHTGGELAVFDSVFEDNMASGDGGAVRVLGGHAVTLTRNTFCNSTGSDGGALSLEAEAYPVEIHNNLFSGSTGTVRAGAIWIGGGHTMIANNVFAATITPTSVVSSGDSGVTSHLVNNVFFGSSATAATLYGASTATYNSFLDTATPMGGNVTLGVGNLVDVDPQIVAYSADGDCANDDVRPALGSPLVDAGDPLLQDPDGSRSDIGIAGGALAVAEPDLDGDGYGAYVDCDDTDPTVHPTAIEACDGVDDDCDGEIDEGLPVVSHYADVDGDGFGAGPVTLLCEGEDRGSYALSDTDCDDDDPTIHPLAVEICNQRDDDCDGVVDAAEEPLPDTIEVWEDWDIDGFGACDEVPCAPALICEYSLKIHHARLPNDCDDANPRVNPDAVEIAGNQVDEDCDGIVTDAPALSADGGDAEADVVGSNACSVGSDGPRILWWTLIPLLSLTRRRR